MLTRIASIKKTRNSRCCLGCKEKGTLMLCWWEYKPPYSLEKKKKSFIWSSNSTCRYLCEEKKNMFLRRYMYPWWPLQYYFYNRQDIGEKMVPIDGWTKKMWCIQIQLNTTQSIKKREILLSEETWMDLESIMLSKISQTKKDNYYMILLVCRIWKVKQNKTHTHRYSARWWLGQGAQCMNKIKRNKVLVIN